MTVINGARTRLAGPRQGGRRVRRVPPNLFGVPFGLVNDAAVLVTGASVAFGPSPSLTARASSGSTGPMCRPSSSGAATN